MSYEPQFRITPLLLERVEAITALRERILAATVDVAWIPAMQLDARARNTHSSTAIEGNPLTLEQVRALEEGRDIPAIAERSRREVLNYFAGLRRIEKLSGKKKLGHEDVLELHRIVAGDVMDQGDAGRYRTIRVRVGGFLPPDPEEVSPLMFELLEWWNGESRQLSPILTSAILHFRFEDIHPFADGNGRTGRALALWELYRRGFDTQHIFAIDEFYWEDRPRYYTSLQAVRQSGNDLTAWLEYTAEGLLSTLERAWARIQRFSVQSVAPKLMLRPRQEQLLELLSSRGSLTPREIWDALGISKQGAMNLINPLLDVGLIVREGSRKSGRYRLNS